VKTARATSVAETIAFGARKVVVTHPDRVLFPEDGITKGDLVHYYRDVAHWMLPYLAERPLTLQRWPGGIGEFSFFEKETPKGAPSWIATTTQPRANGGKGRSAKGDVTYPMAADAPSLAWFANLASITFHVWMSRVGSIDEPDFLLFDLDPFEGCVLRTLARVALAVRDELDAVGLTTLVKSTGGKGLHVLAPLAPRYTYEEARAMNQLIADRVASLLPDDVTLERSKVKRPRGVVYFDWAQLGKGKTIVPPYTVRARAGAPVSMPLAWSEVETMSASRSRGPAEAAFVQWNVRNVPALLAERGDAWGHSFTLAQKLEPALERARSRWSSAQTLTKGR
jgi:bifunctional non-homologous end joining protein LigD